MTEAARRSLFDEHDPELTRIWDEMQRRQVDFAIRQELGAYYTSPRWRDARSVLDIGTGNGHYLAALQAEFPEKRYTGVDLSGDLIAIAAREHVADGIGFECRDLFTASGRYDCVVMRLLLQHLSDVAGALETAAHVTKPGGCAFVIEAYDPLRAFVPDLPTFIRFFETYAATQRDKGLDRRAGDRVVELVRDGRSWRIENRARLIVSSTVGDNLAHFRRIYALFIEMVERAGVLEYDFASVRQEWDWWCGLDRAYAQIGIDVLQLDRI